MKLRIQLVVFFMMSIVSISYAQKGSVELKEKADKFYEKKKYEKAVKTYVEVVNLEKAKEVPDNNLLGESYKAIAVCSYNIGYFKKIPQLVEKALEHFRKVNAYDQVEELIPWLAKIYNATTLYDYQCNPPKTDTTKYEKMYFRIESVEKDYGDSVLIVINSGTYDGIMDNSIGVAYSTYSSDSDNRYFIELGVAEVKELSLNRTKIKVVLNNPDDELSKVYPGDMVYFTVNLPKSDYQGDIYKLALQNIDFMDLNSELLYHIRHLLYYDSPELEEEIIQLMINDLVETSDLLRLDKDSYPEWFVNIDSGRYAGKMLVDILEDVTAKDVYAFLQYVKCYPGKYMGHSWNINITFGTWVLGYAPMSSVELLDILQSTSDDEEFNSLVEKHKKDIIEGGFINNWIDKANGYANDGDFENAFMLNSFIYGVALILNDESKIGWTLFNEGEILDKQKNYQEAINVYKEALDIFFKAGDTLGIAYCYNNIGSRYYNLDEYNNSMEYYHKAIEIKRKLVETNPSSTLYLSLARSVQGLGDNNYFLGNYDKALKYYEETQKLNELSNSVTGKDANIALYYWLGKVNENLGNKTEALRYYNLQYEYYLAKGDLGEQADVLDNIAFNTDNKKESNEIYQKAYEIKIALGNKDDAGFSMSNVAQTYWTLGEYEKAIEAHKLALALRQEAGNKTGQAYSLSKLAGLYKDSGDPLKAIEMYNKALAIYQELGEKREIAEVYADIAETYENVKDYGKAIQNYKKSIEISKLIGDQYQYAENLFDLGGTYFSERKYTEATECYQQSFEVRKEIGDKSGQAYCLANIGLIERIANYKLELAESYFRQAMKLSYETESANNIGYCMRSLGDLFYFSGQYDSAYFYYEEALNKYREIEDKSNEAVILVNIGYNFENKGEFETAEKYFNAAYNLAEKGNDRINMSTSLTAIGDLKRRYGEYDSSLVIENRSLAISKEVDNLWGVASSYLNIGNIYNLMGDFQASIRYYEKCDSLYRTFSGTEMSATPLNNIGVIYYSMGDFDQALTYFRKALNIVENTSRDKDFTSLIYGNFGEIYYYKKMYDSAHYYLNKSLAICTETGNTSYQASTRLTMIRLCLEEDNLPKALENLEENLELLRNSNEKGAVAELHLLFGKYYMKKANYAKAQDHLNKALTIVRSIGSKKILWEPLYLLSDIYRNQGMTDSAITALKESIETIEYLKNKIIGGKEAVQLFSSVDKISEVYELMVEMLMEKGDVEGALKYLEKGNNESLRSKFKNINVAFADSAKNQYISTDKEYKTKIETLNKEIEKEKAKPETEQSSELINKLEQIKTVAQNDYRNFINKVVQDEPSLRNYFSMSENPMDFKAQKRNIPEDMAVLLYLLSEKSLYIFVGTRDSVFAKVVDVDKAEVEQQIIDLYKMIRRPSFTGTIDVSVRGANVVDQEEGQNTIRKDYFIQLSTELYNLLVEPVANEIASKKKLAIIPNGMIYYLPFQVLIKQGEDERYSYLMSKYSIFYTNRLSYLTNMFYPDESCPDMLAIGNADNSLPYAEVEVKTIEKVFDDAIVLVEGEATRKNIFDNVSCYNILHFATHGVLDYNDFDNSFIVLASDPEAGDDGKLKIEEVFGLKSIENCKLVTLSACETAVPMELMEGWPITTASAFLQAGVPSVIASLWSVDDKATSILMEKFYANLQNMETLEALHKAQVEMAEDEKYNHPFYWAPFLLVGSWK